MSTSRKRRWIIIGVALLGLLIIGAVGWPMFVRFRNMRAEYMTAGVIDRVRSHVEKTSGKWPTSWRELNGVDLSDCTRVNFQLDPSRATRDEVRQSIQPRSGEYYTYPHAREKLDALYDALRKYHPDSRQDAETNQEGTP